MILYIRYFRSCWQVRGQRPRAPDLAGPEDWPYQGDIKLLEGHEPA
jgi:hypothetical protein